MLGRNVFGWLLGRYVCVWVTKRDKARGSDEIIMHVTEICANTSSVCVGGCACVCVCADRAGVASRQGC